MFKKHLIIPSLIVTVLITGYAFTSIGKHQPEVNTPTSTKPSSAQLILALEELQNLDILSVPITQTYTTTLDRGKVLWTIEDKVTQKYQVTSRIWYSIDLSNMSVIIDPVTRVASVDSTDIKVRTETIKSDLISNNNTLWISQDLRLSVEEQSFIQDDLNDQVKANLDITAQTYLDKANLAKNKAIKSITNKFTF